MQAPMSSSSSCVHGVNIHSVMSVKEVVLSATESTVSLDRDSILEVVHDSVAAVYQCNRPLVAQAGQVRDVVAESSVTFFPLLSICPCRRKLRRYPSAYAISDLSSEKSKERVLSAILLSYGFGFLFLQNFDVLQLYQTLLRGGVVLDENMHVLSVC